MDADFVLASGRVCVRRWGRAEDPLVVCVHGLTANLTAFAWLAEGLVRIGRQVVAIDCRGRGRSEVTPPGGYGLAAHAADVIELASHLGCEHIAYVGWSMGALIGMAVAERAPGLIEQLVLVDHAGPMDPEAVELVRVSLNRLDLVVAEPEEYTEAIRSRGVIEPWTPFWTSHYTYELQQRSDGSWGPTTNRAACEEDLEDALRDYTEMWRAVTMPTTLVRAAAPIAGTRLVSETACAALEQAVPQLSVTQTKTNHYTVLTDPLMLETVVAALCR